MVGTTQPTITICGLGPGGQGQLTEATVEALNGPDPVFLRTSRHPTASRVAAAGSFDSLYESADTFDDVYSAIADEVRTEASKHGRAVYAVPGSPLVLERSVRHLIEIAADADLAVEVIPAVSFLDEAWARLRVDPVDDGVRLVDGHRFATEAADQRGPLLVAHAHARWVLSDIKLALDAGPSQVVTVLQGLGTDDERIFDLSWPELDRSFEPDHLTSLYIADVAAPVGAEVARSVEMMARLRRECPWDAEQTHRSLRRYLIEEAYEVADAIDRLTADSENVEQAAGSGYADLEEELGDLLFQVLFHSELATEAGQFSFADVARTLTDKMVGRHPHVYGDADPGDAGEETWDQLKTANKPRDSAMDDIPSVLPGLSLADKVLKRANPSHPPDFGQVGSAVASLVGPQATAREVGLVLLAVVAQSRDAGIDAEQALRDVITSAVHNYRRRERDGTLDRRWIVG